MRWTNTIFDNSKKQFYNLDKGLKVVNKLIKKV